MSIFVHKSAEVSPKAKVGDGSKIWNNVQVRENAKIGKNCIIGKSTYIDKNVVIGNNVKVQNFVSIYDGVTIEDDVFIGPHVCFTNDMYPRAFNKKWKIVKTLVKKGASIGANATIICGITIGEYTLVGAGAVVTKDAPAHALVVGSPAKIIGFACSCAHPLKKIKQIKNKTIMKCTSCKKQLEIKI